MWKFAHKIQLVQNSTVRYAFCTKKRDHILPLFNRHEILTMFRRRLLHQLCFIHKVLFSNKPNYLTIKLTKRTKIHTHSTRHHNKLDIPHHRTKACCPSFSISAPKACNSLSNIVTSVTSYVKFKNMVHDLLLQRQSSSTHSYQW